MKARRITTGCFTSVVAHQNQIHAADCNKIQTKVFQHNETVQPEWLYIRSIYHKFSKRGPVITQSISNNQLKCCSAEDGVIKVSSLSGERLQTYGTPGRSDVGQLDCPFISDDDDDGSVLADR